MSNHLDSLEKVVTDLMTQAGIDDRKLETMPAETSCIIDSDTDSSMVTNYQTENKPPTIFEEDGGNDEQNMDIDSLQ